jgi:hypothetical protein
MIKAPIIIAAAAALLSLAACENKPEVVDSRSPDPQQEALKNAAPIELPPAIETTVSFRCQPGNTLLFVDFFKGAKMALLKETKDGTPHMLKAPEAGQPYVADGGYKLTGNAKAATIVLADGSTHTCKG